MLATATVLRSTSKAATCLRGSFDGSRRCAITNLSDSDSAARTWPCSSTGNDASTRSTALCAEVELSVPSTMWPVSAAVSASADALGVAKLADHHHVRVLAQRGAQRARERLRVACRPRAG
jgi:hypothetical protein